MTALGPGTTPPPSCIHCNPALFFVGLAVVLEILGIDVLDRLELPSHMAKPYFVWTTGRGWGWGDYKSVGAKF